MKLTGSWRTTGLGVGALFVLIGNLVTGAAQGNVASIDWASFVPGLLLAVSAIFSRDNTVTDGEAKGN